MPSWNPDQYLKFAAERTRPCRELAARIDGTPRRIADLGCGPGNSTSVLAARFPGAALSGIDSSPAMIEAARKSGLNAHWTIGDIAAWAGAAGAPVDLVFSNAAFQWVADHAALLPALMGRLTEGGALAFQVPANPDAPAHEAARRLAGSARWKTCFPMPVREWAVLAPEATYDILAPHAARIDLWLTDYIQVMESAAAIVEWYKGTGLRPYLDALPEDAQPAFLSDYEAAITAAYPARPDGKVLFPFRRLFCIAYRRRDGLDARSPLTYLQPMSS
jgi:trans-aconitate 2-methyltransferase